MVKRSTKETIYFILVLLLCVAAVKTIVLWVKFNNVGATTALVIVSIVYTLVLIALYTIMGLNKCDSKQGFQVDHGHEHKPHKYSGSCRDSLVDPTGSVVSDAALCKGGPYMWQGDSERSKMCRKMASTTAGRCAISSMNCPNGYEGLPTANFVYTPISDDNWQNPRCKKGRQGCSCAADGGMCSMSVGGY